MKVYIDSNDWWIGAYRGPNHWYVCPLPTVVIRWPRATTPEAKKCCGVDTPHGMV